VSDEFTPPPPFPWKKGLGEYAAFVLEVHVCEVPPRQVYSRHQFQSREDELTAWKLLSSGQEQISFALLTEALRRESYLQALIHLSSDKEFLGKYAEGDEEKRQEIAGKLAGGLVEETVQNVRKMSLDISREILEMLSGPSKTND
jgi:hypothetical protein